MMIYGFDNEFDYFFIIAIKKNGKLQHNIQGNFTLLQQHK